MKKKPTAATAATPLEIILHMLPENAVLVGAKGYRSSVRRDVSLACRIDGIVYQINCSQKGSQS
jgi:hypothetical protein